jgi:hypothetical protein
VQEHEQPEGPNRQLVLREQEPRAAGDAGIAVELEILHFELG